MGRTSSKFISKPKNPLQLLEWQETRRDIIKKKIAKKQKILLKNRENLNKNNQKIKKKNKKKYIDNSVRKSKISIKILRLSKCTKSKEIIAHDTKAIENYMRKQYEENLYGFITNQIGFSTEFYCNYERDIKQTSDDLLCWEHKINSMLEDHSILFTNILQTSNLNSLPYLQDNQKSIYCNGTDDNADDKADDDNIPLQFHRIYIVFENIDITQPNEANYDCISTLCKVNMETEICQKITNNFIMMMDDTKYMNMPRILYEAKWQGYLRLRLLGQRQEERKEHHNTISTSSSRSSGYVTDTDYDYVYKEFKLLENLDGSKFLPKSCITNLMDFIEVKTKCQIYAEDEDDKEKANHSNDFKAQQYLNSEHFMHYFGNLFREELSTKLHITRRELQNATYCAAAIYTRNYEIIPAIHVPHNAQSWPECAYKFKIRARPLVKNYATGLKEQWPSRGMIKQIESFGCYLIPMGYAPKRQAHNPLRTLEWCIVFPKAERYLLQQLTRTQVKVLLMTQLLIRTFCKSLAVKNISTYLRTHLFWTCECYFVAWPEELIGDVLVRFIKSFMQCLRQKRLNDYFIEQRNLFENIPDQVLSQLHTVLSDITANPLMHLLVALKKAHYVKEVFPKLNFSHIFTVLTPKISRKFLRKFKDIHLQNQQWCQRKLNMQIINDSHLEEKSLNIEISTTTQEKNPNSLEELRGAILLEIFLQQLLKMAVQALEYDSLNLVTSLLCQARKLSEIYKTCKWIKTFCDYASIMDRIEQQARELKPAHQHTSLPSTPNSKSIEKKFIKIDLNNDDNSDASLSYA